MVCFKTGRRTEHWEPFTGYLPNLKLRESYRYREPGGGAGREHGSPSASTSKCCTTPVEYTTLREKKATRYSSLPLSFSFLISPLLILRADGRTWRLGCRGYNKDLRRC